MKWLSGLPGIRICYKTLGKKRCFSNIQQTPLEGGTVSLGEDSPVKLVFCFISTEFSSYEAQNLSAYILVLHKCDAGTEVELQDCLQNIPANC